MPFKSEKQRRFLWLKHPDLAKRWAHEYPESNKGLPMYADKKDDSDEKKAALAALEAALSVNRPTINPGNTIIRNHDEVKAANSGMVKMDLKHSDKPTYAGEEREKGEMDQEGNPKADGKPVGTGQEAISAIFGKLSAVLARPLREAMEAQKALEEGREPMFVPQNLNVRRYSIPSPVIAPPMGMSAPTVANPTPQPVQQPGRANINSANGSPVGGGSNPQHNPIQAFGPLGAKGQLNGNAAFGIKNSPDSLKTAAGPAPAAQQNTLGSNARDAAIVGGATIGAPRLLNAGAERTLGAQRFVHGTSAPAAESIMREGLQTRYGGGPMGSAQAVGNEAFVRNSKGFSHVAKDNFVGRRLVADPHAALAQAQHVAGKLDPAAAMNSFMGGYVGAGVDASKQRVGGAMPFERFQKIMRADVDHVPHMAFKTRAAIDPDNLRMGRAGLKEIIAARSKNLPKYIMNNMGRFGRGAALLGGAGYLGYKGLQAGGRLLGNAAGAVMPAKTAAENLIKIALGTKDLPNWYGAEGLIQGRDGGYRYGVEHGVDVRDKAPGWLTRIFDRDPYVLREDVPKYKKRLKAVKGLQVMEEPYRLNFSHSGQLKPEMRQLIEAALAKHSSAGHLGVAAATSMDMSSGSILSEPDMDDYERSKQADSGAWTRAEGKNPEGGLNAKGRASLKAQGHDIKAPVTESNPSGERAKRQNSFCSRMCGMKKVNTGAKAKSDPDSRINKSLRKWNCKCSSAQDLVNIALGADS